MAAYMRHLFPFLGISSPARRSLQAKSLAPLKRWKPSEDELGALLKQLWNREERDFQYAATIGKP